MGAITMEPSRPLAARLRDFSRRVVQDGLVEDSGQDLVEYALLTAFIGLAGLAAWGAIEDALGAAYTGFDTNTQDLWEPPPPQAPPTGG